jgi:hypothetical protein
MSINKAILVGNLGPDPEVRSLPSGQNVANFSVATKARFKGRNGEQQERTDWHRVVAYGRLADNACFRRDVMFMSRGGCEPASTRRGTGAAPAIEPRSLHSKCACSEIARMKLRRRGRKSSDDIPF